MLFAPRRIVLTILRILAELSHHTADSLQKASVWVGCVLRQFPDHDPTQVFLGILGLFHNGVHPIVVDFHAVIGGMVPTAGGWYAGQNCRIVRPAPLCERASRGLPSSTALVWAAAS